MCVCACELIRLCNHGHSWEAHPQWEMMSLPPLSMSSNLYITWREEEWMRNRTFRGQLPSCWNNNRVFSLSSSPFYPAHPSSVSLSPNLSIHHEAIWWSDMLHECQSIHHLSPVKVRWRTGLRWALRSGPQLWGWRSWSEPARWSPWSVSEVEGPGKAYGT